MKRFAELELPDYHKKDFEDILLKGTDFGTNHFRELNDKKELLKNKDKAQYCVERGSEEYFYGFYDSALRYFARALKEDENQYVAWVNQIRVLIDTGKYKEALFWADKGITRFPGCLLMVFAKAYALAYAGQIEQAKRLINKPVLEKNEPSLFWLFRGEVLIKIKQGIFHKLISPYKGIGKTGAFFCFMKALDSNPNDGFMNQRIGITYLKAKDTVRAYEHLKSSVITAPQNPLTLYCLAECYYRKRDYQYALYYTKKAITFNPKFDAAIELLQRLHSPYGRFVRSFWRIVK